MCHEDSSRCAVVFFEAKGVADWPWCPSQKVRLEPDNGTYLTVSNTSPSDKVLGSLAGVINHHGSVLAVVFEPPAPPVTPRGLAPSIDLSAASCAAPREVHSQLLRMTFSSFDPWARQPSEVGGFRAREVGGGLAIGVGWGR